MRYLPGPVDPQKVNKKNDVLDMGLTNYKKNNVDKVVSPPARASARAGGREGAAPQDAKKECFPI